MFPRAYSFSISVFVICYLICINLYNITWQVSVLKHEKEMLSNAEKRACDEVRRLSERVYRLQVEEDTCVFLPVL